MINLRALNITRALLVLCKPSHLRQALPNLVGKLILPMISADGEDLPHYAFLCLGISCCIHRALCLDYFFVFASQVNFAEYEKQMQANPFLIISLKCLFDFYLIFNLESKSALNHLKNKMPDDDENSTDPSVTLENLTIFLFKAEILVRTICIEGDVYIYY